MAKVFYSPRWEDYIRTYAEAKFSIMNRVHGTFVTASFGRPAFTVGADSRAQMVDELNLKRQFVGDASVDSLLEAYEDLKARSRTYGEEYRVIKEKAQKDYEQALAVL